MKLYMKCTTDKFELPLIVEESPMILANKMGISPHSVATMCSKQICGYHRIEVEERYPDNDGGTWHYDKHGRVVHEY
jgi:hypothetical protein